MKNDRDRYLKKRSQSRNRISLFLPKSLPRHLQEQQATKLFAFITDLRDRTVFFLTDSVSEMGVALCQPYILSLISRSSNLGPMTSPIRIPVKVGGYRAVAFDKLSRTARIC